MTEFMYDDITHSYILVVDGGERKLPSVSQVLQKAGMYGYPKTSYQSAKMALGTHIHQLTDLYDQKILFPQDLEEEEKGYIEAYRRFSEDVGLEIIQSEKPIYHPKYLYGAKPDRIGYVRKMSDYPKVIEIKTGQPHPANMIQLSAYHEAHNATDESIKVSGSVAVYIAKDGNYKLLKNEDHEKNFSIFLSCMQLNAWKERYGIGKYEQGGLDRGYRLS